MHGLVQAHVGELPLHVVLHDLLLHGVNLYEPLLQSRRGKLNFRIRALFEEQRTSSLGLRVDCDSWVHGGLGPRSRHVRLASRLGENAFGRSLQLRFMAGYRVRRCLLIKTRLAL